MTRKDFDALAKAFSQATDDIKSTTLLDDGSRLDAMLGLELVLDRMMPVLEASNPNFSRLRFRTATAGSPSK